MKARAFACAGLLLAGAVSAQDGGGATLRFEGEPEAWLPGIVTREHHELQAAAHPRGNLVLWSCADCRRSRGSDLWSSVRRAGNWSRPDRAKPSSGDHESAPAFSPDGSWLYYVSDRKGGRGGADLYRIGYSVVRDQFSSPENLGPAINSPGDEGAAAAYDGDTGVIFASRGREGARGWDLFESRRVNGRMADATALTTLDTRDDEFDPALLPDGSGLLFARARAGKPESSALWFAPRHGHGYGEPQRLDAAVNAPGTATRAPAFDPANPGYLLFTRIAADGDSDIVRIRYRIASGQEGARAADDR